MSTATVDSLGARAHWIRGVMSLVDRKLSLPVMGLLLLLQAGLLYLAIVKGAGTTIASVFGGIIGLCLILRYPILWLYSFIVIVYFLHREQDPKVTAFEVVVVGFYCIAPVVWMLWQSIFRRKKIIHTPADFFLLAFFGLLSVNAFVAALNGVEMFEWLREVLIMCLLLYFFPFREHINTKLKLNGLLALCGSVLFAFILTNIQSYRTAINTNVSYLFQLYTGGMPFFQTFFMIGTIILFTAVTFSKKTLSKILLSTLLSLTVAGLITTFQRTYWVFSLLGCIFVLFFAKKQEIFSVLRYMVIFTLIGVIGAAAVLGNRTKAFQKLIESRLSSTSKLNNDASFYNRVVEANAAMKQVSYNPLSGNGIRKPFAYYNYITLITTRGFFIHNGFMASIYKYGIPMTVLFYFSMILYAIYGFRVLRKSKHSFHTRLMSVAGLTSLLVMLSTNYTHVQFDSRMGNIAAALSLTMIFTAAKLADREKKSADSMPALQ